MGTKFRTLLAPIGMSTGDGRRFADGGLSLPDLPMPFEWARARDGGHDGAVVVGAIKQANIGTAFEAIANGWIGAEQVTGMDPATIGVWASGELFDDIDREAMPRLAEDVAEAMHLMSAGTLGPSVDLDSFEGVPVLAGSSTAVTPEQIEAHFALTGEDPKLELLVTSGRVRAATLVSIPAFAETSRPLELIANEPAAEPLALIASVATEARPALAAFDGVALTGPTPITYDFEAGRVFGHIATWRTCHVGYSDVCVTAPRSADDYAAFNRYPVETEDGVVWAGRLTVGGRHAGLSLTAAGSMAEHDAKTVAGYVRAYEDEFGIAVAGVLEPGLDEGIKAIMSRRKVSGDWRETSAGLSLIEVLALAPGPRQHSEPGFPVETFSRNGRQVALVASLSPDPETAPETIGNAGQSVGNQFTPDQLTEIADKALAAMERRQAHRVAVAELTMMVRESARSSLADALKGA
jgi:hypothetical protein